MLISDILKLPEYLRLADSRTYRIFAPPEILRKDAGFQPLKKLLYEEGLTLSGGARFEQLEHHYKAGREGEQGRAFDKVCLLDSALHRARCAGHNLVGVHSSELHHFAHSREKDCLVKQIRGGVH